MKQFGIRDAQVNLTKLLNDLPFEITRFGKVVAHVIAPEISKPTIEELKEKTGLKTANELMQQSFESVPVEPMWGNPKLYCFICHSSPAMFYKYKDENGDEYEKPVCKRHIEEHERTKNTSLNIGIVRENTATDLSAKYIPIPKPKKKK